MNNLTSELPTICKHFLSCTSKEEIYQRIMHLGITLPSFDEAWKIEQNLVPGCQSVMYLKSIEKEGVLTFFAHSDALISKGLAAIMVAVYSNQSPEWILQNKPLFLEKIGIIGALTPSRSNGVLSLYDKMQQEALSYLTSRVQ